MIVWPRVTLVNKSKTEKKKKLHEKMKYEKGNISYFHSQLDVLKSLKLK